MELRSKKILAMDFETRSVRVVEGSFKKGSLNIMNQFSIDLPKGIYEDGYIRDEDALREILDSGLRLNNIKRGDVIAVVDSPEILTREISLPNVNANDIEGILQYKIGDYIPIDIDDYIVQYIEQGSLIEAGNEKLQLFIIAMPKNIIISHMNLLKELDLKPKVLDYKSNAVRKLLNFSEIKNSDIVAPNTSIASIDFGFANTKLTIFKDKNIKISRIINMGIRDILEDLNLDPDFSEKEVLDKILNLENIEDENCQIAVVLRIFLIKFFESLEMVFRYYNSLEPDNRIDLIFLQNIFAESNVLKEKFYEYLNIQTVSISSLKGILDKDLNIYSTVIGSLIRGETK